MAEYQAALYANSPLLTYDPPLGTDPSKGWVDRQLKDVVCQYYTSAPKASVSFDFYGDQFSLGGYFTDIGGGNAPSCAYNVTLNGTIQQQPYYWHQYQLPVDHYHVDVTFFCPQGAQNVTWTGPSFIETQGTTRMQTTDHFLNTSDILTYGPWRIAQTYQDYFSDNFPQYMTTVFGSTLLYSFHGLQTLIFGHVGPHGGYYLVTLDGIPQTMRTSYTAVDGNVTVLFWAQELEEGRHEVAITNLGGTLDVQVVQYTEVVPPSGN